jgi:hypothetical protein
VTIGIEQDQIERLLRIRDALDIEARTNSPVDLDASILFGRLEPLLPQLDNRRIELDAHGFDPSTCSMIHGAKESSGGAAQTQHAQRTVALARPQHRGQHGKSVVVASVAEGLAFDLDGVIAIRAFVDREEARASLRGAGAQIARRQRFLSFEHPEPLVATVASFDQLIARIRNPSGNRGLHEEAPEAKSGTKSKSRPAGLLAEALVLAPADPASQERRPQITRTPA